MEYSHSFSLILSDKESENLKDFLDRAKNTDYLIVSDIGKVEYIVLNKRFWLSIKKAKDCLFSRRTGVKGCIIRGYSIRLRLFNIDII